jgi:hypothetical protein
MKMRSPVLALAFSSLTMLCSTAQVSASASAGAANSGGKAMSTPPAAMLEVHTMEVAGAMAHTFFPPLKCDAEGNLFLSTQGEGLPGFRKLNPKGEELTLFRATSPDIKINIGTYFSLAPDGTVYQLIMAHEQSRYVFAYKSDGNVKSEIKLQPGFFFTPYQIAAFGDGTLLVMGMERDSNPDNPIMWPYEAIFSSSGSVVKELHFEDDDAVRELAVDGDSQVTVPSNRSLNLAIVGGAAETALDGNVYVMRRVSPAIFDAVSPGGALRRFIVDPGRPGFGDPSMHIAGTRIAVLFYNDQTRESLIKVVDLEGREVATYEAPAANGGATLGRAFICYQANPDRFTFLTVLDQGKLGIKTATAK